MTADYLSTRGGRELDPIYGPQLAPGRYWAINGGFLAAYTVAYEKSHGKQKKWVRVLGYTAAGIRFGVAIRNMRVR